MKPSASGTLAKPFSEALTKLAPIRDRAAASNQTLLSLKHELKAYEDVLTDYIRLLVELDESLTALERAALDQRRSLPDPAAIRLIAQELRRSIARFEKART